MDEVIIYTDGAADPNPGFGGWAAILRTGKREKVLSGAEPHTTNNRMELQAAIGALSALKRPCRVTLYTDSSYLRRGITEWIEKWSARGWRRAGNKPVPNADLWRPLWELAQKHEIDWQWVRGHAGNELNERVDELAREARLSITPAVSIDPDSARLTVRASCRGNPGPGGWGAVLEAAGETRQMSGSDPQTTNNRMELMGAIAGLDLLPADADVTLVTASDYVFQGATRWIHGWRQRQWRRRDGQVIANADLWQELDRKVGRYRIRWLNAKGGNAEGQQALDEAARLAQAAVDVA